MKNKISTGLICFAVVAVFGLQAAWADNCKDDSRYPTVSKAELASLVQKKAAFVIDVNSEDSFKESHIPTAIHYETNQKTLAKMLPEKKDALIVAYCGGEKCTAWKRAAVEACKLGYTNIKHFKPGISGWNKS